MTNKLGNEFAKNAGESDSRKVGDEFLVRGFLPTIGIETHVQLATKTKLFSSADNDARDAEPNSKISAIDYALPGMLPVLNREALKFAARAGKALNSKIANVSRWDRKHYFYPDSPKGYQITQMYSPTIIGGFVELRDGAKIRIHHAHIEEDAGKLTHHSDHSLIDLNRVGTPLIEIVGEPDIHSAKEAREYAEELHGLMTYSGVTNGDLYYGNMRFDVNISVAKPGEKWGLRTEIKNLNSFRAVERATNYEINRQIDILEDGGKIEQGTRGWNDNLGETTPQRSKEDAQDYRYMPDPDIPPVILTDEEIREMQEYMPKMPHDYRKAWSKFDLDSSVIEKILQNQQAAVLIESVLMEGFPRSKDELMAEFAKNFNITDYNEKKHDENVKRIFNWFASTPDEELDFSKINVSLVDPIKVLELSQMTSENKVSSSGAKSIFLELFNEKSCGKTSNQIAEELNLLQVSDEGAIAEIVRETLEKPECIKAVEDFKAGNEKVIGFLVGQVMKNSAGKANPSLAQKLIREKLAK